MGRALQEHHWVKDSRNNWTMDLLCFGGVSHELGGLTLTVEPPGMIVIQVKKRMVMSDFLSVVLYAQAETLID